jgi:hypothetical protein
MMSMTSENVNQKANIGGATLRSAPQICRHHGHYVFTAKRLVYRGRGNYDSVYFTVYSHHRNIEKAKHDIVCTKSYGYYEPIGTLEQNDLVLLR